MFGHKWLGGYSLGTERTYQGVKHHQAWLVVGLLLLLVVACNLRRNNTSNNSNRGGSAKVTTADRPANADVWVDTINMARDNGGQPGEDTSSFTPGDRTIYCVIHLNLAKTGTVVRFVWEAIEGTQLKPILTTDYTTKPLENVVTGNATYPGDWPKGSYQVVVYINGALDKTIYYTIE
jgi:hypothetical protein